MFNESLGVIYAPFQIAALIGLHSEILSTAVENHPNVVVALPVRRITPSKRSPLNFKQRMDMILERYPSVLVVPVVDRKYIEHQVSALEHAVFAPFSSPMKARLYTDNPFADAYPMNSCPMKIEYVSLTNFMEAERTNSKYLWKTCTPQEGFRRGVFYALSTQFPISWPTVDIAIKRVFLDNTVKYLLGRKPGETGWRFPGGFKDRDDLSFEDAVYREAGEEVLKPLVAPRDVLTQPVYIGSSNIHDWRYRDEPDGITTSFFLTQFTGLSDQIKAGDDLGEIKWVSLDEMDVTDLEGEHADLWMMLLAHERNTK